MAIPCDGMRGVRMNLIEIEEEKGGTPHGADASAKKYYSVEFSVSGSHFLHQFKIRKLAASSMGVLVGKNSEIIDLLKVGDVIKMKYNPENAFLSADLMDTEIRSITKESQGRFNGHYFIGLGPLAQPSDEHLN
jgi:hypothetical protein